LGKLRATTAPSEQDRAIATKIDRATREVEGALRVAREARGQGYRARRVERDLGRALAALHEVGSIAPRYGGGDDPDLITEDERNKLARERREAERVAAQTQLSTYAVEGDG
jgi:hypothetical protein